MYWVCREKKLLSHKVLTSSDSALSAHLMIFFHNSLTFLHYTGLFGPWDTGWKWFVLGCLQGPTQQIGEEKMQDPTVAGSQGRGGMERPSPSCPSAESAHAVCQVLCSRVGKPNFRRLRSKLRSPLKLCYPVSWALCDTGKRIPAPQAATTNLHTQTQHPYPGPTVHSTLSYFYPHSPN